MLKLLINLSITDAVFLYPLCWLTGYWFNSDLPIDLLVQ